MLSLHIGRVAETHWVNSGMQKLQLPSLPKVEVILPFFIWGPWPFRIFAWIGATNFGVPPPVSLHHDF